MIAEAGRIVLRQPPAAKVAAGACVWCGETLTEPEVALAHGRTYCDEREGRDCRTASRKSFAQGPREALIDQARDAGRSLHCDICGAELATFTERGICAGKRQWVASYRTPLDAGGRHVLENLRATCRADHPIPLDEVET